MKLSTWADEMAQWVKVIATKPDNLGLMPGSQMVEGKN